jgi:two-component system chemotaxis response regulator CheY
MSVVTTSAPAATKTVLAVDDSATMRQLVSFALRGAGFQVIEAVDGNDALTKLNGVRIDLIITDLNMPNINGIELIRRARTLAQYKYVPIVMLTTESLEAQKKAGRDAGASGWIVKPFQTSQLVAVARKFLG